MYIGKRENMSMIIAFAIPFFVSPSKDEMPSRVACVLAAKTSVKEVDIPKIEGCMPCLTTCYFAAIYLLEAK
jgi:hypothetical protein